VARQTRSETKDSVPKEFPEVLPSSYPGAVGGAYLIESVMQMQKSIGELSSHISHLTAASEKHGEKIDRISHRMYAAGIVLTIVLGIGGFLLNKIWDGVFKLLQVTPYPPG